MKTLRKAVLVGWVLGAAIGMFGGANTGTATVSAVSGIAASDTGWG